jgi:hypothetical protein
MDTCRLPSRRSPPECHPPSHRCVDTVGSPACWWWSLRFGRSFPRDSCPGAKGPSGCRCARKDFPPRCWPAQVITPPMRVTTITIILTLAGLRPALRAVPLPMTISPGCRDTACSALSRAHRRSRRFRSSRLFRKSSCRAPMRPRLRFVLILDSFSRSRARRLH